MSCRRPGRFPPDSFPPSAFAFSAGFTGGVGGNTPIIASPLAKTIPAELDSGVWNIGMSVSDVFGSWLFARYHVHFMQLVWLNAGTTALTLLAVPLLPGRIVKPREEERLPPA